MERRRGERVSQRGTEEGGVSHHWDCVVVGDTHTQS